MIKPKNRLIDYLSTIIPEDLLQTAISKYFIGSSNHWKGATIFWQVDCAGNIKAGRIMLYDAHTGLRIKYPRSKVAWVHKTQNIPNFTLNQCFFGEHLIKSDRDKTICVVESEKTALIASIYYPQFIWIATGGINNLALLKSEILNNREVIFFPDLNGYTKWESKIKQYGSHFTYHISSILEENANEEEKKHDYDIADYLINYNVLDFHQKDVPLENNLSPGIKENNPYTEREVSIQRVSKGELSWERELILLENYFKSNIISQTPIKLKSWIKITDPDKFVMSHLKIIRTHIRKERYLPYLNRLLEFKEYLENRKNHIPS